MMDSETKLKTLQKEMEEVLAKLEVQKMEKEINEKSMKSTEERLKALEADHVTKKQIEAAATKIELK